MTCLFLQNFLSGFEAPKVGFLFKIGTASAQATSSYNKKRFLPSVPRQLSKLKPGFWIPRVHLGAPMAPGGAKMVPLGANMDASGVPNKGPVEMGVGLQVISST